MYIYIDIYIYINILKFSNTLVKVPDFLENGREQHAYVPQHAYGQFEIRHLALESNMHMWLLR